jgi:hypothetical protein
VPSNAVAGFLPSRHGFAFANTWPPATPARTIHLGLLHVGIGDVGRGLCGGMAFAARDRFERGIPADPDLRAPDPGTALFDEIADRQFDSFGPLWTIPLRFWAASMAGDRRRLRDTVRAALPAIRAEIDAGRPPMIGLVRQAGWNPLALGLGHQVVGYRYDASPEVVTVAVYDPNHPGLDDVTISVERAADGAFSMRQSTGEPLIGVLALPFTPAS